MRRREFITALGGAAAAWPFAASAQPAARMPRIGVLMGQAENDPEGQARAGAFRDALTKLGWSDGRNVQVEYRWLRSNYSVLDARVSDLIRLAPDVIMTNGTQQLAALQRVTKSIPVVFAQVSDPVGGGFVASIAHPGGNITGFTDYEYAFAVKWLELLKEIAPGVARVGVVYDANNFLSDKFLSYIENASPSFGMTVSRAPLRSADDIEPALSAFPNGPDGGLIILAGTLTLQNRDSIIMGAARYRLPAVYPYRAYALSGGLTSYGVDVLDMYRGAASYVDRIIKGEKAADLPVQFATKFEFVVNLKTSRAIGVPIPTSVLLRAGEVIE